MVFFESVVDRAAHEEVVAVFLVKLQKLRHLRARKLLVSLDVIFELGCVSRLLAVEPTQVVDIVAQVELAKFDVKLAVSFHLIPLSELCDNGRDFANLEVQALDSSRVLGGSQIEELDVPLVTNPVVSLLNKSR